jgi:hypothetical protein
LARSLDAAAPWSPIANLLASTWFLWAGFYNFYFGVVLFAFTVGFYIRRGRVLNAQTSSLLSLLLIITFATHILPAVLALFCIALVAVWLRRVSLALVCVLVPTVVLIGAFVLGSKQGMQWTPLQPFRLDQFVNPVFASNYGLSSAKVFLYPGLVCYAVIGILLLRRKEWASARGAIALAAGACFLLFLVVPGEGFGGGGISPRIAWAAFVLASTVALSGSRMQIAGPIIALVVAGLLATALYQERNENVVRVAAAAADYNAATKDIPAGARVARVRFVGDAIPKRYGYSGLMLDPMIHADSWVAARKGFVALTDYQALSKVFATELRPPITDYQRGDLWSLEVGNETSLAALRRLLKEFPVPIDYVLVTGEKGPTNLDLGPDMELMSSTPGQTLLRVYRRTSWKNLTARGSLERAKD